MLDSIYHMTNTLKSHKFNNTRARMLDSIYHMTNTLKSHFWRKTL